MSKPESLIMNPLISVVIPVYNVSDYIDRCLLSLKNQGFRRYEVIIVDDCGQDDSIEKVKLWALEDNKIRILHHEKNLGTYHARHTGVKFAAGEYVVFLDPDDAFEVNALDELSKLTVTKPDVILFGSKSIPKKKCFQVKSLVPEVNNYKKSNSDIASLLNFKGFNLGTLGKAYNRKIIKEAFWLLNVPITKRLVYGEDVLLFSEVVANAKSMKSIPKKIYLYHQVDSSITKSKDLQSILRNIEQLNYVIYKLKSMADNTTQKNVAYKIIMTRLSADVLVLKNKTNISFFSVLKNYFIISVLTKNIRWLIKALLYILLLGKKQY